MNSSQTLSNDSSTNPVEEPPNAKKPRMSTISGGNKEEDSERDSLTVSTYQFPIILMFSFYVVNVKKVGDKWKLHSDDGTALPFDTLKDKKKFNLDLSRDLICCDTKREKLLDLVYSSSLNSLRIHESEICHQEFFKLLSSDTVKDFCFVKSEIVKEGEPVNIDNILNKLPNIENFKYVGSLFNVVNDYEAVINKKTLINIAKLPPFSKLKTFELEIEVYEFNIDAFCKFIKKHPEVKFVFRFYNDNESFIDKLKKETKKAFTKLQKSYDLSVKFMQSPIKY